VLSYRGKPTKRRFHRPALNADWGGCSRKKNGPCGLVLVGKKGKGGCPVATYWGKKIGTLVGGAHLEVVVGEGEKREIGPASLATGQGKKTSLQRQPEMRSA